VAEVSIDAGDPRTFLKTGRGVRERDCGGNALRMMLCTHDPRAADYSEPRSRTRTLEKAASVSP